MMNRRNFLLNGCAGLGVASGFASNLASMNAFAQDAGDNDYKALVCVFLFGAMDCHDTVIPYDQTSYSDYEVIREILLARLDGSADFASRRRDALLELAGAGGNLGGRSFAFPEELRPLHELYQQGDLAVVGNVGPLIEPVTRTTFRDDTARLPPKLFSHNDQQSIWMASQPEGASTGWGGRFSDLIQSSFENSQSAFTSVSAAGASVFLVGDNVNPFQVSSSGALSVDNLDSNWVKGSQSFSATYEDILRNTGGTTSNLFGADVVDVMRASLDTNELLEAEFANPGDPMTAFPPDSSLAGQLNVVARMIARNETFGMKRQIFFVATGGFDTHSNQAEVLPALQADVASSIRAFHDSMIELGLQDKVTTFTASDFGRTLGLNNSGSDHGWGSHHLVVGGAVNGGRILGNIPPPAFEHQQDAGRGRLIPELSVDQYAAALGRWYGLSESQLQDVLPGLANFDSTALDGLFNPVSG